jgi:predicted transcriptional regulator
LTAARRCGPRELVGYENVESTQPITIGMLSERTGVGIETIRYYERIGILPKPPRTLADTDTMPKKIDRA